MTSATSTVRSAVGIGALTALSRLVGFGRVLVVAAVLGTTYLGNAFQSANSVSNVVFELVAAGALSSVLVPIFKQLIDSGRQDEAEAVAGGVLGVALVGLGGLAAIGMVAAPWLADALTLGVPAAVAGQQRDLVAFLLLFFLPQVALYAAGTVATGVLHARSRFYAVAAAPMANTVVMVASLAAFSVAVGPDPSFDLSTGERLLLALAGTGGVLAFTAVLVGACRAAGFRLRPRWPGRDPRVGSALRQAGWGVVLHSSAGVLLGGAILAGAAVEGGVVAYQVAWVFFLAPYAIFAQPIQTAVLPELVEEAGDTALDRFATSVRWAVERIALPMVPISIVAAVLAGPAMRLASVGAAQDGDGPALLAAALASLAIGLVAYAGFLFLARAFYALGDSRTPGLVAIGVAVVGAGAMAVGAAFTAGTARIGVLGLAHSVAHVGGLIVLAVLLQRRTGRPAISSAVATMVVVCSLIGAALWVAIDALAPAQPDRWADLATTAVATVVGAVAVAAAFRLVGLRARLTVRAPAVAHPPLGPAVARGLG